MAVASDSTPPASASPQGPAQGPGPRGAALSLGQRFLTLREGSIIVVTLITFIYFAATHRSASSPSTAFKALLPYFAPFAIMAAGEVFVMINGEIDLSIGAVYLFTPFVFYKFNADAGFALIPALILSLVVATLIGVVQRDRRLRRRDLVVRRDARDAVHARRADADHLPRDAGHNAGHVRRERSGRSPRSSAAAPTRSCSGRSASSSSCRSCSRSRAGASTRSPSAATGSARPRPASARVSCSRATS